MMKLAVFDLMSLYKFEKLLDLADALSKHGFTTDVAFCTDGLPLLEVKGRKEKKK